METDGTINGQEALNIAAHILVDHFAMLVNDSAIPANATSRAVTPEVLQKKQVKELLLKV